MNANARGAPASLGLRGLSYGRMGQEIGVATLLFMAIDAVWIGLFALPHYKEEILRIQDGEDKVAGGCVGRPMQSTIPYPIFSIFGNDSVTLPKALIGSPF